MGFFFFFSFFQIRTVSSSSIVYRINCAFSRQVESEFILESERESFIEQVREVIETADERGLEREGSQVLHPRHLEPLY